jgi:hypothetical protein
MDDQLNESQSTPTEQSTPKREPTPPDYWRKPKKRWPRLLALIILIAIGFGLYWLFSNKPEPKPAQNIKQTASTQTAAPTKTYSSINFSLNFNYPESWTVVDNGGGQLTVTSPATQLKSSAGSQVTGKIILTISQKGQSLPMFDKGSASAVIDSQKITYTKPTQSQRGDTYVSYLQYATTTTTGALDGVFITGDYGYQKNQDIPKVDIANLDPVVSVTFTQCANSTCGGATTPLGISASTWSNSSSSAAVLSMLKSLSFN